MWAMKRFVVFFFSMFVAGVATGADLTRGILQERTYESPVHGSITYAIYTPPNYYATGNTTRYPVIYWLHGSGTDQQALATTLIGLQATGSTAEEKLDDLINSAQIPPVLIVAMAAPGGVWNDALLPLVTEEFIDFMDSSWRTIARRSGRGIEGFSLGSQGVSMYATARPDLFASASMLGGGFLGERWTAQQTAILRDKLAANQLVGDLDSFLPDATTLRDLLDSLTIPNSFEILAGVNHNSTEIYQARGVENLQFHTDLFAAAMVVDAGADQLLDGPVPLGTTVTGVIDNSAGMLGSFTTLWEQVGGPSGMVSFTDDTAVSTTATFAEVGEYFLRLTATDGVESFCDVVAITVVDLSDSLEAHFELEDLTISDATGNGHDGSTVGSPTVDSSGAIGNAVAFDGAGDVALIPDFSYGPEFSVALWLKAATDLSGSGYQYLVSHNGFDLNPSFNLFLPETNATEAQGEGGPGRLRIVLQDSDDSSGQFTTGEGVVNDGRWHQVTITAEAGVGHVLYYDGEALDSDSNGGDAYDPPGDINLAGRSIAPVDRYFAGSLDDVRIYNRPLNAVEARAIQTLGVPNEAPVVHAGVDQVVFPITDALLFGEANDDGLPSNSLILTWSQVSGPGTTTFADGAAANTAVTFSVEGTYTLRLTADDGDLSSSDDVMVTALSEGKAGLIGRWPMDEGAGTTAADTSGLGHDGTLRGDLGLPSWVSGREGTALDFNGADNQAVLVADAPILDLDPGTTSLTLMAWVNMAAGESGSVIAKAPAAGGQRQYQIYVWDHDDDGTSTLFANIGGEVNVQGQFAVTDVADSQWHHVAVVHNFETMSNQLYIDAVAVGGTQTSGVVTNDVSVLIGARRETTGNTGFGFPMTGSIDDPRIYNRVVSVGELEVIVGTVVEEADLSVAVVDAPDPVSAGGQLTYTVTVDNAGPGAASGVSVTSSLPPGTSLVSTSGCGGDPSGVPTCTLGTIANGAQEVFTITIDVPSSASGSLGYSATVGSATSDPNSGNDTANASTAVTQSADLQIIKTVSPANFVPGQPLEYTLTVSNLGFSDAVGSTVADVFPAQVQSVTWVCSGSGGGTCAAGGSGDISETVDLPAGASVTFVATGTVQAGVAADISNTATCATGGAVTDPNASNNSSTAVSFWSDPIFTDNFETGDTTGWVTTVGGS